MDSYLKELEKYLSNLKPFKINIAKIYYKEKENFFGMKIEGDELLKIHYELLDLTNPFRNGVIRFKDKERLGANSNYYTDIQKEMLQKYGFARNGKDFHPHITLGSIRILEDSLDIRAILEELNSTVSDITEKTKIVDRITVTLDEDNIDQAKMKNIFRKEYLLCR